MEPTAPEYYSVTYGAGGSEARAQTVHTVDALRTKVGAPIVPHITTMQMTERMLTHLLEHYRANQLSHLVVLRGDPPGEQSSAPSPYPYAKDLIAAIRKLTGDYFHIEVACYPEKHPLASDPDKDFEYFVEKVQAGANGAITQYFYNVDAYFSFLDKCQKRGVTIPIVPGIMPITKYDRLLEFSKRCGAEVPRWIRVHLENKTWQNEQVQAFGVDVLTRLCEHLRDGGAPALHFYTLNQSAPSLKILDNLDIKPKKSHATYKNF